MLRTLALATVCAALLVGRTASAAEPLPPAVEHDLHCLVVAATFAQNSPAGNAKQVAESGIIYFLGKVDGEAPGIDLEARVREEIPKLTAQTFMAQVQACGGPLQKRFDEVTAIGDRLRSQLPAFGGPSPSEPQ